MYSSSSDTQRRRILVQNIVSPAEQPDGNMDGRSDTNILSDVNPTNINILVPCSICHSSEGIVLSPLSCELLNIVESEMDRLELRFGRNLGFCSFCFKELNRMVEVKRDMERLAEKFSNMVVGLHGMLSNEAAVNVQNQSKFVCKECHKRFKEEEPYRKHLFIHTPHSCFLCFLTFGKRSDLSAHNVQSHPELFPLLEHETGDRSS